MILRPKRILKKETANKEDIMRAGSRPEILSINLIFPLLFTLKYADYVRHKTVAPGRVATALGSRFIVFLMPDLKRNISRELEGPTPIIARNIRLPIFSCNRRVGSLDFHIIRDGS